MKKSLKYWRSYQNVTQSHKVSKCHWKNGARRLNVCTVAANLQLVKKQKNKNLKHGEMRYAYI